jgi:hypothetical protein
MKTSRRLLKRAYAECLAMAEWCEQREARMSCLAALVAFLVSIAIGATVLDRFPNSGDEYVYLYQADTMAAGRLSNPAPAEPDAFPVQLHRSSRQPLVRDVPTRMAARACTGCLPARAELGGQSGVGCSTGPSGVNCTDLVWARCGGVARLVGVLPLQRGIILLAYFLRIVSTGRRVFGHCGAGRLCCGPAPHRVPHRLGGPESVLHGSILRRGGWSPSGSSDRAASSSCPGADGRRRRAMNGVPAGV